MKTEAITKFIRDVYDTDEVIPLHAPSFHGREDELVSETLESTFVSSVGKYVEQFESMFEEYTGVSKAVATVNGTSALQVSLELAGVSNNDLVFTQSLTFIATCNAISQAGASPIFIDVNLNSLGMCPHSLEEFIHNKAYLDNEGILRLQETDQAIKAVLPMHTFGHPIQLDEISKICKRNNLELIEDAAESVGSYYKGKHLGTQGRFSALSFNGNKIITTGGGGMILCKDKDDGNLAKHITTTAKLKHKYEFFHDQNAYNYRMPNLNAALGCAQFENLDQMLKNKRVLAETYENFFKTTGVQFFSEPDYALSNYWLNAVFFSDKDSKINFLEESNDSGIGTRPIWTLMTELPMYKDSFQSDLSNSLWIEERLVCLPSSYCPNLKD